MFRLNALIGLLLSLFCHFALATNVTLTTINGERITFSSLQGKWVFINYWASWCQPCLDEIRELNRFYQQQQAKVALFAVNYDMLPADEQLGLIKKYNIRYPSLQNDPAKQLHLGSIPGVPATFVFNPQGKLSQILYGPQTVASLKKASQATIS
ncbi:TlpA disulfide reductase family protein [Legionella hackeliae]|uniref:Thiol-disulfide oxidoreductase ResA n=1 Tax=Legionella hackeliae TaxID=449 RepID=A0A0A8UNT7_LEGHA|nr:TlpA disulfide reductase family protein [Legionella hackeliae]KTD12838.1 thiol-disulfide oxidoreductase [Legionella hackeliae]CEK09141.1 Thiol-disulfide oxidoreductase ResA [Legionella hackeliae]STX49051.1 thiol-disulfide oxidoreductase [Legionella hackeliae]